MTVIYNKDKLKELISKFSCGRYFPWVRYQREYGLTLDYLQDVLSNLRAINREEGGRWVETLGQDPPISTRQVLHELSVLLLDSFEWNSTPQGFEYWRDVHRSLFRAVHVHSPLSDVPVNKCEEPEDFPEFIV